MPLYLNLTPYAKFETLFFSSGLMSIAKFSYAQVKTKITIIAIE